MYIDKKRRLFVLYNTCAQCGHVKSSIIKNIMSNSQKKETLNYINVPLVEYISKEKCMC